MDANATEPHTPTSHKIDELRLRVAEAERNGGAAAAARQEARGRGTARERVAALVDPGSFVELDGLARHRSTAPGMAGRHPAGDGVVTGTGSVDGRRSNATNAGRRSQRHLQEAADR